MTHQISKTDISSGAAVKFPFELKDDFRAAFKSAKWNAQAKQWEVGSRSVKRLDQWIEQVQGSGVIDALNAHDEADLQEKEIQDLQNALEDIKKNITVELSRKDTADARKAKFEALRDELEAKRDELAVAAKASAEAYFEAQEVAQDIEQRVSHIATVAQIDSLRIQMKKNFIPKAYASAPFNEAQSKLREIQENFEEIGVRSRALDAAVSANKNRRDRDYACLSADIEFVAI